MMFVSLILFACVAMMWPTGEVVSERAQLQTAADASAYAASVRVARATNLVTATNMLMVQNLSVYSMSFTIVFTAINIVVDWADAIDDAASIPVVGPAAAAVVAAACLAEFLATTDFWFKALPTAIQELFQMKTLQRVDALANFQTSLINATPRAIEDQRKDMADYFRCDIRLTQPGRSDMRTTMDMPFEDANFLTVILPKAIQFFKDQRRMNSYLRPISIGNGQRNWRTHCLTGFLTGYAISWATGRVTKPKQLRGSFGLEFSPTEDNRERYHSIIATASRERGASRRFIMRSDTATSGVFGGAVFGAGVNQSDTAVAYAQAEVYNGIDGIIGSTPFSFVASFPWRMWSSWGWQWQPRLSPSSGLVRALQSDSQLRTIFQKSGVTSSDFNDLSTINLH